MKYLADRSQHSAPRYDREGLATWASRAIPREHRPRRIAALASSRDRADADRAGSPSIMRERSWPKSSRPSSRPPSSWTHTATRTERPQSRRHGRLAAWAQQSLGAGNHPGIGAIDDPRPASPHAGQCPRRQAPPRNARDGKGGPAPDPRLELDGTPSRHGSPAQLDRTARLCPDRPQGRIQAGGNEDLRRDVDRRSPTASPT